MTSIIQFVAFCAVGCINTAIDFGVFNLLGPGPSRLSWIRASLVSTTAGMAFSFIANWHLVFQAPDSDPLARAVRFVPITLFSSYCLQSTVIYFAGRLSSWKDCCLRFMGHNVTLPGSFLARNYAKTLGIASGILWNFLWYKYYVFT